MSAARVWRRPFVKARAFWGGEVVPGMAIGTGREQVYFTDFSDGPLDAPEYMPGGAMRSNGKGVVGPSISERGK